MEKETVINFGSNGIIDPKAERIWYTDDGKIVVNGVETDDDAIIAGVIKRHAASFVGREKPQVTTGATYRNLTDGWDYMYNGSEWVEFKRWDNDGE